MIYRHGVYMSEIPSTVKAPIESDAGVIVVVGTAPVNMADDPYHATNTPCWRIRWQRQRARWDTALTSRATRSAMQYPQLFGL